MKIYVVTFFDDIGWCTETVGYYSSYEKAQQFIEQCGKGQDFDIKECTLDQPFEMY